MVGLGLWQHATHAGFHTAFYTSAVSKLVATGSISLQEVCSWWWSLFYGTERFRHIIPRNARNHWSLSANKPCALYRAYGWNQLRFPVDYIMGRHLYICQISTTLPSFVSKAGPLLLTHAVTLPPTNTMVQSLMTMWNEPWKVLSLHQMVMHNAVNSSMKLWTAVST